MQHTRCTRDRLTTTLLGLGLSGREALDMAAWLADTDRLISLHCLSDVQVGEAAGQIENAADRYALVRQWRDARRVDDLIPTPEQLRREVTAWRW